MSRARDVVEVIARALATRPVEVEVIESGEFRRNEGPGESFGEIALLHDVPRTATVRTTVAARFLVLESDQFLFAVTGHRRSHQRARTVIGERWIEGGPDATGLESDQATAAAGPGGPE